MGDVELSTGADSATGAPYNAEPTSLLGKAQRGANLSPLICAMATCTLVLLIPTMILSILSFIELEDPGAIHHTYLMFSGNDVEHETELPPEPETGVQPDVVTQGDPDFAKVGFYWDQNANKYEPCPTGCLGCKHDGLVAVCTPCADGYFYEMNARGRAPGICKQCSPFCPMGLHKTAECTVDRDMECSPPGLGLPVPFQAMTWPEVKNMAVSNRTMGHMHQGSVTIAMWNGTGPINSYMREWLPAQLRSECGVELDFVGLEQTRSAVDQVQLEMDNGVWPGQVDMMWINGQNFKDMMERGHLWGPWADRLPSSAYFDFASPSVALDFGYPTAGFEMPFNEAQSVFIHDTARLPESMLPKTIPDLMAWIKANPGQFAYPDPTQDFTGAVVVRHFFYHFAGPWTDFTGQFNEQLYLERAPLVWEALNELEKDMWLGEWADPSYPRYVPKIGIIDDAFARGEVAFTFSYNPNSAAAKVDAGEWPATAKAFLLDDGTIANTNFWAIPLNAPNKAAAMCAANLIASPAAMYERSKPEVWGALQAFEPHLLPDTWMSKFESMQQHPSTPSMEELVSKRLAELDNEYVNRINNDWAKYVRDM